MTTYHLCRICGTAYSGYQEAVACADQGVESYFKLGDAVRGYPVCSNLGWKTKPWVEGTLTKFLIRTPQHTVEGYGVKKGRNIYWCRKVGKIAEPGIG